MRRKTFAWIITVSILLTMTTGYTLNAATFQETSDEAAVICEALGMLQGTGGGVTPSYLATTPQRYQGAILLLRLIGSYDDALVFGNTNSYMDTDTFSWVAGRKILNYLYNNQGTIGFKGYPDSTFKPYGNMDAKQYYKVMLVALGYEENVDFAWNPTATLPGTLEMAQSLGMTWLLTDTDFTIGDLAVATVEALRTPYKGMTKTLGEKLADEGIIDGVVAQAAGLYGSTTPTPTPEPTPVLNPLAEVQMSFPYEIAVDIADAELLILIDDVTFKTTVGEDSPETTTLLDGIVGSLATSNAWNDGMRPLLTHGWVTRVDDHAVKINMSNISDYAIDENEVITVLLDESLFNETIEAPLDAGQVTIVDSGAGLMIDPYALLRPEDFMFVARHPSAYFEMATDMDFTDKHLTEVSVFSGSFDGNNHTISNLTIDATTNNGTGLFSTIDSGTVQDVKFQDCTINGSNHSYVGFIAGKSNNLQLSGIYMDGSTLNDVRMAGLLIGRAEGKSVLLNATLKNSSIANNPAVSNLNFIGGAIGGSDVAVGDYTHMTNINLENVDITSAKSTSLGGLVGYSSNEIFIDSCKFSGNIVGKQYVGGIIASPNGPLLTEMTRITNSTTYGTLTANSHIGGIVALVNGLYHIENNYAGLTSMKYNVAAFNDAATHRILGFDNGTKVLMDNTANSFMKVLDFGDADHSDLFVSDAGGVDGLSMLLLIPLFPELEIYQPLPVIPGPWEMEVPFPLEELVMPLEEIEFEIPHDLLGF